MNTSANILHPDEYRHFPEFKRLGIDLRYMSAAYIQTLEAFRVFCGIPLTPSGAPGAWYRFDGDPVSRHYAVDRLSDAGDVFPERGKAITAMFYALNFKRFGGIGLYLDTNGNDGRPWLMLHLDTRPGPAKLWIRDGKYHFFPDPEYCKLLDKAYRLEV